MKNTELCIKQYMEDGHLNNIAIRVGRKNEILADVFMSDEKQISAQTVFDMASITKIMVTTMLALIALDKNMICLEDTVNKFFETDSEKQAITIKNLLTHTMGIGYKPLYNGACNYDNIAEYILKIPSDVAIGTETMYSCPGYILLGKILEKVMGEKLDKLFYKYISTPLGLKQSEFCPKGKYDFVNSNLLPEEIGMVNDYNCRFLGGICGNAGLFSCIDDASIYAKMLLNYGNPLISEATFKTAIKNYTESMKSSRGLGFVYVDEKYTQTANLFTNGSIGHCGHTGQSVFVDLNKDLYVIILSDATNSVIKKYDKDKYDIVMKMRHDIHSAIKTDLSL